MDGVIRLVSGCVDAETFNSGKKLLRIQKYPDTCGRGPSRIQSVFFFLVDSIGFKTRTQFSISYLKVLNILSVE